ncbi:thiol-specific monooxygenase [Drepanopeziza brunnea f. sp. 'multigermtubi' MB_m1]|uniref:Thiol-specific monooxygenase n=1 Tax=Marssonina brunnea f. sp. multigermtubi (strain MB_m1) TaxID=1072389 RepID=K1X3Y4_MARBU|nr:thiol-specific monooxygenase [Drepanopeziza brunnea f. sp. 'multigermtubi' MB_m1]EKD19712.1 thiol-specific monooxygenase [Drepanopeziza brunnea f. sp. 'multigermtubi' MB_m1]
MATKGIRTRKNATSVAVIGAGVSGLCAAKYLLAERSKSHPDEEYFQVTIFERAPAPGGIWYQTAADDEFATPMYPACSTNVPRTMMQYEGVEYPKDTALFPENTVVQEYLQSYARELHDRGIIRYGEEVTLVRHRQKDYNKKWQVECRKVFGRRTKHRKTTDKSEYMPTETTWWDAVVVALGTFAQPDIPPLYKIPTNHFMRVMHSKFYRGIEEFRNKRVLIVGRGPSYWDTAREISRVSHGEVLVSTRTDDRLVLSSTNQRQVSEVASVSKNRKLVTFKSAEYPSAEIDIILLCTGYTYDFSLIPCIRLSEDKKRVVNLYEHMIFLEEDEVLPHFPSAAAAASQQPRPSTKASASFRGANTLALVGLLKMDATFLVAEAQSALIARHLSGRWTLSVPAMKKARAQAHRERKPDPGDSRGYHNLSYPRDADYVDQLFGECLRAESPADAGTGLAPPFHSAYLHWVRGQIGAIRTAFNETARDNRDGRYSTPESLGFSYQPDPDRERKSSIMERLRTLIEEKSVLWKAGKGLREWQKRWDSASREWQEWVAARELASLDARLDSIAL